MPDLHTQLLAEIERREGDLRQDRTQMLVAGREWYTNAALAYLGAMRRIVEMHDSSGWGCNTCNDENRDFPCGTIRAVAEALEVEIG